MSLGTLNGTFSLVCQAYYSSRKCQRRAIVDCSLQKKLLAVILTNLHQTDFHSISCESASLSWYLVSSPSFMYLYWHMDWLRQDAEKSWNLPIKVTQATMSTVMFCAAQCPLFNRCFLNFWLSSQEQTLQLRDGVCFLKKLQHLMDVTAASSTVKFSSSKRTFPIVNVTTFHVQQVGVFCLIKGIVEISIKG